jgi:hypothetical protein
MIGKILRRHPRKRLMTRNISFEKKRVLRKKKEFVTGRSKNSLVFIHVLKTFFLSCCS